jgi:hypothetical protein
VLEICPVVVFCDFEHSVFGRGMCSLSTFCKPGNSKHVFGRGSRRLGKPSLEGEAKSEICTFDVTRL